MVFGSTLLAVHGALSPEPQPLRDIAEVAGMQDNTVRECLLVLIQLGLAEKIEHSPPKRSAHKGGWVRVEYRAIAVIPIAIKNEA